MCLSTKSSLCKFLPEKHGKTVTYYMGLYELITVVQLKHAFSISERKKQSKMFFAFFSSLFASFHQYHFLAIFDCFFFIPVQVLYGQLLAFSRLQILRLAKRNSQRAPTAVQHYSFFLHCSLLRFQHSVNLLTIIGT